MAAVMIDRVAHLLGGKLWMGTVAIDASELTRIPLLLRSPGHPSQGKKNN
jgi:hypothetical protein